MKKAPSIFSLRHKEISITMTRLEKTLESLAEKQQRRCGCCGVTIHAAVGPIFIDGDGSNADESNLIAACQLCEALHNAGKRQAGVDPGILIYLPDVSQIDVISMSHALRATTHLDPQLTTSVAQVRGNMRRLSEVAQAMLGFCDAASLEATLLRLSPKAYANRAKILHGIHWMPLFPGPGYTAEGMTYLEGFATKKELELM